MKQFITQDKVDKIAIDAVKNLPANLNQQELLQELLVRLFANQLIPLTKKQFQKPLLLQ